MGLVDSVRKFFAGEYQGRSWVNTWGRPVDDRNYLARYNGYVYACVSAIAEDVALIEPTVSRVQQDGTLVEAKGHSFLTVLDNPNAYMSKYQLFELTQTHIELAGEAFWYMELGEATGKPKSLHLLPPGQLEPAIDTESALPRVKGYVFTKENGTKIPLDPEEIVHFKMPNPWNPWRGYGTVEAAILYIMTERYGAEYTRNFIYNNATPSGIVNIKGKIAPDAFEELKRQWKQKYGNLDNAGKTAFVNGDDIGFTKIGTNLSESALKEVKDMSRDDIMTMFRVSKPILGIFEDVNLASAKTAQYVFMSRVIDPKMGRLIDTLQSVLDRWNTPNLKYQLGYISPVPEDQDAKVAYYKEAVDTWMTINEVRELENLGEVPGGDVIRRNFNLQPISDEAVAPVQGNKLTIKRTVPKALDYQRKENFRQELMANQEQYSRRVNTELIKIIEAQRKEVMVNFLPTKDFEEKLFDDAKSQEAFVSQLTPIEYQLLKEQGAIALAFAGAKELEFQVNEKVKKEVRDRIIRMGGNFNTETKEKLIASLTQGSTAGESVAQMKKRIEAVYRDAKGYRAERIARTETLSASNAAASEAYRQTGYIVKEEWFANPGACEFCLELDGKVVGIEEHFASLGTEIEGKDGGTYRIDYTNVERPPLHPNCTCSTVPVRED